MVALLPQQPIVLPPVITVICIHGSNFFGC